MATESACLLLTDISGYTGYLGPTDRLAAWGDRGRRGRSGRVEPVDRLALVDHDARAVTTEFEPTPGGTILHQRFAAPKTAKERAIMERIASWMEEALRTSTIRLIEQLDEELERRDRDAIEEPALPRARPDGPVAGLSSVS